MRRTTKKLIQELLRDYPQLDARIKLREEELKHPVFPTDENIGGGRSSRKTPDGKVLNMIITLEDDEELAALKRQKQVINYYFSHADSITREIIKQCYFQGDRDTTIGLLVDQELIPCERTAAYKYLNNFMAKIARALGLKYY